jgi:hypothetical protein
MGVFFFKYHIYTRCGFHTCGMKEEGGRTTFQLEEAEHQIAPKPFMGLVKMGPVVEPGYVIRDNFSGTPHFEWGT